jgi:hypothetical protein
MPLPVEHTVGRDGLTLSASADGLIILYMRGYSTAPTATMEADISWMLGKAFREVNFLAPESWFFGFGEGVYIRTESAWRIIVGARIALSSEDHEQWYGLPSPVDAEARCQSLLVQNRVERAEIREDTRDIVIVFESGARLEILPVSSGYESWQVSGPDGSETIAQGGGNLVVRK